MPSGLNDILYTNIQDLIKKREALDLLILSFSQTWTKNMLSEEIYYQNPRGMKVSQTLDALLRYFFNHQIHPRSQVIALLAQADSAFENTGFLILEDG